MVKFKVLILILASHAAISFSDVSQNQSRSLQIKNEMARIAKLRSIKSRMNESTKLTRINSKTIFGNGARPIQNPRLLKRLSQKQPTKLSLTKDSLELIKHNYYRSNKTRNLPKLQLPSECEKIKCPMTENPVCAKLLYKNGGIRKPFFVIMLNDCEIKYLACHKNVDGAIVPMKYCHPHINKTVVSHTRSSVRHKREINQDPPTRTTYKDKMPHNQYKKPSQKSNKVNLKENIISNKLGNKTIYNKIIKSHITQNKLKTSIQGNRETKMRLKSSDKAQDQISKNIKNKNVKKYKARIGEDDYHRIAGRLGENTPKPVIIDKAIEDIIKDEKNPKAFASPDYAYEPVPAPIVSIGSPEKVQDSSDDSSSEHKVSGGQTTRKNAIVTKQTKNPYTNPPDNSDEKRTQTGFVLGDDVDRDQYYANCPTVCPARDVMVCALCSHEIYKTFQSICHMRMFQCHNDEKDVTLVSRTPCIMSAPYFVEDKQPQGRVSEPGDTDLVLKFIRCRERGILDDPRCQIDKHTKESLKQQAESKSKEDPEY